MSIAILGLPSFAFSKVIDHELRCVANFRLNFVGREKPVRGAWLLERLKRKEMPECWGKDAGRIERQDHTTCFFEGVMWPFDFPEFLKNHEFQKPGFSFENPSFLTDPTFFRVSVCPGRPWG